MHAHEDFGLGIRQNGKTPTYSLTLSFSESSTINEAGVVWLLQGVSTWMPPPRTRGYAA